MLYLVLYISFSLLSSNLLAMEGNPTGQDFQAKQRELLTQASFSEPYDPANPDARNRLISLLKSSLRTQNPGVNAANVKSPNTDAALTAQAGGSLLHKLMRRKTNSNIATPDSPTHSARAAAPESGASTPKTEALSAAGTPTNGSPREVPELAFSDNSVGFYGLAESNPVVEAMDHTIREVGYTGFLELLEDKQIQKAFETEADNSPRLVRARSESPGRISGALTPKSQRTPTTDLPALAAATATGSGSASAPVSPSQKPQKPIRQGSGLLRLLHKKSEGGQ